jgi:ribosomal protein L7/L12
MAALWQGHMIEAIKLVRLEQNLGLHEAKDLIDTYLRS